MDLEYIGLSEVIMLKEKSIFYKLIKCSKCGVNYRKIKDRQQINYICQSYSTQKECSERNTIKEEDLLNHVRKYCQFKNKMYHASNEYMQEIIDHIIALPNNCFEIHYKDGTIAYLKEDGIKYV